MLIYRNTDFTYTSTSGSRRHVVTSMTQYEAEHAADEARKFVGKDIPPLHEFQHGPNGDGALPRSGPYKPFTERRWMVAFTAGHLWRTLTLPLIQVIVIWDPRARDQNTGESIWIGSAAGLTPAMGTGQTYMTLIIEATGYGHRNVFKRELGTFHSRVLRRDRYGSQTKSGESCECIRLRQLRHRRLLCLIDETDLNPIPNSIYNDYSGFTHDYYSGTTARASEPTKCLGIGAYAWALGGPVSNSATYAAFAPVQIVNEKVNFVIQSTSFDPRPTVGGSAGVFTINATLTTKRSELLLSPVKAVANTLSGGNTLLSATEGNGSTGSKQLVDVGPDFALTPGEPVNVQFRIGLATRGTFNFLVDIEGVVRPQ